MKKRKTAKRKSIRPPTQGASGPVVDHILWTRLANRTEPPYQYVRAGELAPDVRWVKIVTRRAEDQDFDEQITFIKRRISAIALIENAIADGQARAYQYKLVASAPPAGHQMSEEAKAKLRQLREEQKNATE